MDKERRTRQRYQSAFPARSVDQSTSLVWKSHQETTHSENCTLDLCLGSWSMALALSSVVIKTTYILGATNGSCGLAYATGEVTY
jgi:hypothetical protein